MANNKKGNSVVFEEFNHVDNLDMPCERCGGVYRSVCWGFDSSPFSVSGGYNMTCICYLAPQAPETNTFNKK